MPKAKTHKATAKRITVSRGGKLKHRKCGQNHFNSRETGKTGREKRLDGIFQNKKNIRTIKMLLDH